ncbi:MAG: prephenate dehydrogenase/arogenate dehydrogenase family protein [bacterium]
MIRKQIGILGFGRFGQFWARTLQCDHNVFVTDANAALASLAAASGVAFTSMPELCARAEAIFLCVPVNHFEATVRSIKTHLKPHTTVLEVCSVKVYPAEILMRQLGALAEVELIATHPMFGPDSGANGLSGLPMVMWPLRSASSQYQDWRFYFSGLGLRVVEISPEEHDRLAANSQGVTHYLGRVLQEMNLSATPIDTKGFELLLSVIAQTCNDTWELFYNLQNYNPFTGEMRLRLEEALDRVYSELLPERISQHEFVIGIQGGRGSFNEEACRHYCAQHADRIPAYRVEYLYTSNQVLAALHQGKIDFGVFAIQNARGGVVMETIHALSKYDCEILEIFDIVISHCLLRHPEAEFGVVDSIISHPQALAQCADNLSSRYPRLQLTSGEGDLIDQALCARYVAEGKLPPSTAVLAPKVCAELYGLKIHDADLQDLGADNLTTFAWARRRHYFRK